MSTKNENIENVGDVIREVITTFRGGRRWIKGTFATEAKDPSYCLIGAVGAVLGNGDRKVGIKHPLYQPTKALIAKVINPRITKKVEPANVIVPFNDSARTTFARVEAILAAALVKARKLADVSA